MTCRHAAASRPSKWCCVLRAASAPAWCGRSIPWSGRSPCYGKPVYVRHEIVHNRYVVESLRQKGAVFVEELDEIPDANVPVMFSAHGVPKSVPVDARRRKLLAIDATCPLVTKVHREAEIHFRRGREIILIGHAGHPEVIGTMGQLPPGAVRLVQTAEEAATFVPNDPDKLAYVTQTTLSVDDTADIVAALKARFPHIAGPHKEDICYATTNRQEAVKRVAPVVDAMIVVGSPNSSNSQRLKEVALRNGCPHAELLQRAADIDWARFGAIARLGLTAGASAPEVLDRGDHRRLRRALRPSASRPYRRWKKSGILSRCRARSAAARRRSSPNDRAAR